MPPHRILLVGQALNRAGWEWCVRVSRIKGVRPEAMARRIALTGAAGRKMASIAGVSVYEYLNLTERRNLLDYFPGKAKGGGDAFDLAKAREVADRMRADLIGRRTILLGRQVAAAFGYPDMDPLAWHTVQVGFGRATVAVVPHPSGASRYWNSRANVLTAGGFLRQALGLAIRPDGMLL